MSSVVKREQHQHKGKIGSESSMANDIYDGLFFIELCESESKSLKTGPLSPIKQHFVNTFNVQWEKLQLLMKFVHEKIYTARIQATTETSQQNTLHYIHSYHDAVQ